MMIYIMLPFVNRKMDRLNNDFRIAELPFDYALHFKSNRYRFKRRLAEFHSKYPNFSVQKGSNRWVYEDTDPKTLSLYQEEVK